MALSILPIFLCSGIIKKRLAYNQCFFKDFMVLLNIMFEFGIVGYYVENTWSKFKRIILKASSNSEPMRLLLYIIFNIMASKHKSAISELFQNNLQNLVFIMKYREKSGDYMPHVPQDGLYHNGPQFTTPMRKSKKKKDKVYNKCPQK